MESSIFEPARECYFLKNIDFDTGEKAVVAQLYPIVIGQQFGLGGKDIEYVILTSRHEGKIVYPISSFPCFVYICHFLCGDLPDEVPGQISKDDLQILAWGEIYRSEGDAVNHVFD